MKMPPLDDRDAVVSAMKELKGRIAKLKGEGKDADEETSAFNGYAKRLIDLDCPCLDNPNKAFVTARKGAKPAHLEFYVDSDGADIADENWRHES